MSQTSQITLTNRCSPTNHYNLQMENFFMAARQKKKDGQSKIEIHTQFWLRISIGFIIHAVGVAPS